MPLHLLPKKSWNVYNADNIARVRRDEAAAAARVEAEEQRMQEEDAARRMAILRGESPVPLVAASSDATRGEGEDGGKERDGEGGRGGERGYVREKKRRKLRGEDDTEMEMRYAANDNQKSREGNELKVLKSKEGDVDILDKKGHINLFTEEEKAVLKAAGKRSGKNAEVEKEKKRKEREMEDQYTMRFSNAAGFKEKIGEKPWYFDGGGGRVGDGGGEEKAVVVGKDVWGNEDPRRRERERGRVEKDDPLAAIKKGVAGVRKVEKERDRWKREREAEVGASKDDEERRRERRRKRRRAREEEELETFRLDGNKRHESGGKSHHRRHRSRSHERHNHRHRHKHERGDEAIRA
ncbi:MAG: hypothetical protein OHK93_006817 [Ramalina farinacea]|uniref:CBF1-interacting co-repressor CIR N-terminal domain-containing protein n=1 Tax=Ramalina farinacea TaxID=258253 RepID=A0AA43TX28_9LECA|nr:hypothetical protein [Ramalina farinacea]